MSEPNVPASAIDAVPDEAGGATVSLVEYEQIRQSFGLLQTQFEELDAEYQRLSGSSEVARAALIRPYAWAVLRFVCAYGAVVSVLLGLQGFGPEIGFHINDGVMGVVVGSTAVSAIGLVLTVVRGLFPSTSG